MFSRGDVGHRFDKFTLALWMICAPKGPQMRFERKFLREFSNHCPSRMKISQRTERSSLTLFSLPNNFSEYVLL